MKAFEFQASINPNETLPVPSEVATQLHPEQPVRVLILVPEPADQAAWARLTAEQFLKGYDDSDAIYNDLSAL